MRRRFEGRGEKSKDAAEGAPVKSEVEEEASSETRASTVEKELIGLKEEVIEVKMLLKLLTEGKQEIEPKEPKEGKSAWRKKLHQRQGFLQWRKR